MELIKEKVSIGEVIFSGNVQTGVDGDLIVPDVKADISKILQVDAAAYISSKTLSDGRLTVSGKVDFNVLYMPDSDEPIPEAIHTSVNFSHRIENPKINENCNAIVNSDIGKVDFHVINSRKLSLRSIVVIYCDILGKRNIEFASSSEDEIESCTENVEFNTLLGVHDEEFLLKDSVEIPSGKSSVGEILKIDCSLCDKEVKSLTEKIILKGSLNINILYTDTNNCLEYTEAELPFTEVFDFPDLYEDDLCDINTRICDFAFDICADSDGDMRIINIESVICAEMKSERTESFTVIKDCFMPGCKTTLCYSENEITQAAVCTGTQSTLRDCAALPANLPCIKAVYSVSASSNITQTEVSNGKISVSGKAEFCIQYISDDPKIPLCSFPKNIPFDFLLDCPAAACGDEASVETQICHISYHLNVAGEVEIRCILAVSAKALGTKKTKFISDIETEEIPKDKRKGIVIYFVQPGDTLWKISKEYSICSDDIAEFNSLTDKNNLSVGQRLIIPAKKS